ncbi:MAG: hypothetical protein ABJC13_22060 [Acidobacteriota bacterium]
MSAPIRHTLRFAAPESHYLEVESSFPAPEDPAAGLELSMAVWTPGSYLIREYSRHVESISAEDSTGGRLPIAKTRKNRWRVVVSFVPQRLAAAEGARRSEEANETTSGPPGPPSSSTTRVASDSSGRRGRVFSSLSSTAGVWPRCASSSWNATRSAG